MKPREKQQRPATSPAPVANDAPAVGEGAADPGVVYGVGEGARTVTTESPGARRTGVRVVLLPNAPPANDERAASEVDEVDALLAADPEFAARCDAQRDEWIEAMERSAASETEMEPGAECAASEREGHGHDGT